VVEHFMGALTGVVDPERPMGRFGRLLLAFRPTATSRVWALTTLLAGVSLALYVLVIRDLDAIPAPVSLPVWLLAIAFAAGEIFVVNLQFRRDTHSFSLSEIPLVLGLFFLQPELLLVSQLVGSAMALWFYRRQPPVKLAFNVANLWATTTLAVLVFRFLDQGTDPSGPSGWLGAFGATLSADALSLLMITAAIALSSGPPRKLVRLFATGGVAAFFNTSLALVIITILWFRPEAVWLPMVISGMLWVAYRGYASVREKHESLEVLYESSRAIQESIHVDSVLSTLLTQTREMFRAQIAEILLFAENGDGLLSRLGPGDEMALLRRVPLHPTEGVWARVAAEGRGICLPHPIQNERLREHFIGVGITDVLVVPLHGDGQVTGTMLVANRHRTAGHFTSDDLKLLETLGNSASISLENGRLVERLRHQADESEQMALHDALTGLPNRRLFRERLETSIADRARPEAALAVMIMDVDRFKEVNDTLGHHNGDLLLREIAERLSASLLPDEVVARLSGDEFALLLPDITSRDAAIGRAERLLEVVGAPYVLSELTLDVAASIGIALYPEHGLDMDTLLRRADVAMYLAKEAHTGRETYSPERDPYSPARLAVVGELRHGIENGELVVHYQPKADLASGRIVGAEALVRWQHPVRGLVMPDDFVPIAEHTGLLRPLTLFVLEAAIRDCRRWEEDGVVLELAVNLSVRNLLDLELPNDIARLLAQYGLPAERLELEITETTIMSDPARTLAVLARLRELGLGIAIDDFGIGHSSLAYLKRLPVNELKIDRTFVMNMATSENDHVIVRSTIELAKNLGLRVVAEGVETLAVWQQLRELGCDQAQGYFLSRPVVESALLRLARRTHIRVVAPLASIDADGDLDPAALDRLRLLPIRTERTG
jgi:diguanylate cyclase (GGDEF)-like protein